VFVKQQAIELEMDEGAQAKTKTRRWRVWLMLAIVLLLAYFLLPITLTFLAFQLIRQDPLQPADIVIAMGGGVPCLRPQHAVKLYRQGLARKIVLPGLPAIWGPNAIQETRQSLVNFGAAEADIVMLEDTRNTRTEAEMIVSVMREKGWKSALVVTDPYHTRRTHYTFRQAAPDLTFYAVPLPAGPHVWEPERWWTRRDDMWFTVRESIAWINTLAGGLR
jgi:uncharacterized SAM-binding protein YcdF (DUF218 family)